MTDFLYIDGIRYDVPVLSGVKIQADFLDKSAVRTEDGDLNRELIGVYYNYRDIKFGKQTKQNYTAYENLWAKLSEPEEFHIFKIANYTFKGYVSSLSHEIYLYEDGKAYKKNLKVNFTSKQPSRT